MDGEREVRSQSRHFNGEHTFGDKLTGSAASNADAQDSAGGWLKDEFGDAVVAIERRGPAGGPPGEASYLNGTSFLLGLGFGQTTPGNLRIGEHHRRDGMRLKCHLVPSNGLNSNTTFVRGFRSEERRVRK